MSDSLPEQPSAPVEPPADAAQAEMAQFCREMGEKFGQPIVRLADAACLLGMQYGELTELRAEIERKEAELEAATARLDFVEGEVISLQSYQRESVTLNAEIERLKAEMAGIRDARDAISDNKDRNDNHWIPRAIQAERERDELRAEIERLTKERDVLRRDAARYRHLRDPQFNGFRFDGETGIGKFEVKQKTAAGLATYYGGSHLDERIDAELMKTGQMGPGTPREMVETCSRMLDDALAPLVAAGLLKPFWARSLCGDLRAGLMQPGGELSMACAFPRTQKAMQLIKGPAEGQDGGIL